jgi:hypothetical protein
VSPASAILLFACWWAPVLLLALLLKAAGLTPLRWPWIAAAAACYAAYALAGYGTLPAGIDSMPAEARWYSRLAQLATVTALIVVAWNRHPLLTREGLGLRVAQVPGSWPWSIAGVVALALLGMLPGALDPGPADPPAGAPGWLYHLTLPGLEEELIYRALLLSLLAAALGGSRTAIGWAAVLATMVFALAHGIYPDSSAIGFDPFMIAYTGLAGTVLVAMRLRSGSLLWPMVGHNLIGLTVRLA